MEGEELFCKNGTYLTNCQNCYPPNPSEDDYYYYMTEGGCGDPYAVGKPQLTEIVFQSFPRISVFVLSKRRVC